MRTGISSKPGQESEMFLLHAVFQNLETTQVKHYQSQVAKLV
jgi:hypothetical protein